jgi:hypothetical protein
VYAGLPAVGAAAGLVGAPVPAPADAEALFASGGPFAAWREIREAKKKKGRLAS